MGPTRAKPEAEKHTKSKAALRSVPRRATSTRPKHVAFADTELNPNRTAARRHIQAKSKVVAQPLPVVGKRVTGDEWFRHLFGFSELVALGGHGGMSAVAANFELGADGTLRSLANGASYGAGFFAARSLADLRADADRRASAGALPLGKVTIRHVATPDVYEMHTDRLFTGSTVMAASQFNALEFHDPKVTPEEGVTNYTYDRTQGPACALAAPAAAVFRNYFLRMPSGATGQRAGEQLNLLGDLLLCVQGCTGDLSGAGKLPLVCVHNGYTASDNSRLRKLNARIAKLVEGPLARDELLGALRVGLHSRVEVPWAPGGRFILAAPAERRLLSQVFCSALACGYSDGLLSAWAPLARLALDGAYEATLLAAVVEASAAGAGGRGVALLTFLGGGVFGNKDEWIDAAMARAVVRVRERGVALSVVVAHHGRVDEARKARIAAAIRAEEKARGTRNATTRALAVSTGHTLSQVTTRANYVTNRESTKKALLVVSREKTATSKPKPTAGGLKPKRGLSGYNIFIREYEPSSARTGAKANEWRDLSIAGKAVYNTRAIAWNKRNAVEQPKPGKGIVVPVTKQKTPPIVLASKTASQTQVVKPATPKQMNSKKAKHAASAQLSAKETVPVNGLVNLKRPTETLFSARYTANAAVQSSGAWLVWNICEEETAAGHPIDAPLPLTWAGAIDALCSGDLGPFLSDCICASPHAPSLFWETPAFSRSTLSLPFEFVTLPAPHLARARPDGSEFAAHFRGRGRGTTATFTNLRGDATLVVPCPPPGLSALHAPSHGHLFAFVRDAPAAQRQALWCAVGIAAREAAKSGDPTWLSTAGSGVPWLHIRLDARPKYYHHLVYTGTRSVKGQVRRSSISTKSNITKSESDAVPHRRKKSKAGESKTRVVWE